MTIQQLFERQGYEVKGDRVNPCPFCASNSNSLQIKNEDEAQCFNPDCPAHKGMTINEAAKIFGVVGSPPPVGKVETKEKTYKASQQLNRKMYDIAADFYHKKLKDSPNDLSYQIEGKGHSIDIIEEFRVGIVKDWEKLYNQLCNLYDSADVEDSGLFKFEQGVISGSAIYGYTYPITYKGETWSIKTKFETQDGKKIGMWVKKDFTGDDWPSFLNASIIDDKDVDEVWIVEGENDCLAMVDNGYRATIAVLGTPSKGQLECLNQRDKTTYVLAMDNDDAGEEHTKKIIKGLNKKHTVKLLKYDNKDPYDALKSKNPDTVLNRFIEEENINFETEKERERRTVSNFTSYEKIIGKKTTTMNVPVNLVEEVPHFNQLKDMFYSWSMGGDGKPVLICKNGLRAVRNKHHFTILLNDEEIVVSFKDGMDVKLDGLIEKLCDTCQVIDRITTVKEFPRSDRTLYTGENEVPAERNGLFRELIELFSLKDIRAQYRLAAAVLSIFLGESFDSFKPLFDITADGTSAGKTSVIVALLKIVLRQNIILVEGNDNDDRRINSLAKAKLSADLFDNINARLLRKNGTGIIRRITDPDIPLWLMGTSHGLIPNAFTHFGTFHGTEGMSMDNDFQARHLNIEMASGSERTMEDRVRIPKELKEFEKKHYDVLADIYWIMENPNPNGYSVKPHEKCALWSQKISQYLKTMFPEVEEFDFQPLESDIELDDDRTAALDILEEWWKNGAATSMGTFIPFESVMMTCKEKLGENHWACRNRLSPSKFFRSNLAKLEDWDIDFRTREYLDTETQKRGWTIQRRA